MGTIHRHPRYEIHGWQPKVDPSRPRLSPPSPRRSDRSPLPDYVVKITFDNLEDVPTTEERRRTPRKPLAILLAFLAGFALAWLMR